MENESLTPLFALAVSMAFEIRVDEKTSPQEKGRLIALFGKLVEMGTLNGTELQSMIRKAFSYAEKNDVEVFLQSAAPVLSYTQKLAIVINLYDTMQADGHVKMGERGIINKFEEAFNIEKNISSGIRKFLMLKNDTSIFVDASHPLNNTAPELGRLFNA